MFSDCLSIANSRNPHYQHAKLRSNDGQHGVECFEKENRQQGKSLSALDVPRASERNIIYNKDNPDNNAFFSCPSRYRLKSTTASKN